MKNVTEPKRLYRSKQDKVIAGVCSGIAEYFSIDPVWVRLGAILLVLADGIGIILYILAWILIPENPSHKKDNTSPAVKNIEKEAKKVATEIQKNKESTGNILFGAILIILGSMLFFKNVFGWFSLKYIIPLLFIAFGVYILQRRKNEKNLNK